MMLALFRVLALVALAARPAAKPKEIKPQRSVERLAAVGDFGPIGAYGPLGALGPVGDRFWNPSRTMRLAGDWSGLSRELSKKGGPLSGFGPLGPTGPLGKSYVNFPREYKKGGDWAVLGPTGPLGVLGALGPLGPTGAHGYATDAHGNYVSRGRVQRMIDVPYEGGKRRFELFEKYDAEYAAALATNDTSFMVEGNLIATRPERRAGAQAVRSMKFPFTSRAAQHVHVLVTPEMQLDRFEIRVLDQRGEVLATSDSSLRINFVQLEVPKGTRLHAEVRLSSSGHLLPDHRFRLFVTGSTSYVE